MAEGKFFNKFCNNNNKQSTKNSLYDLFSTAILTYISYAICMHFGARDKHKNSFEKLLCVAANICTPESYCVTFLYTETAAEPDPAPSRIGIFLKI